MRPIKKNIGTFTPNKEMPIHRWYPYIEGYSSELVERELLSLPNIRSVYDPFGGCGTTPLIAAQMGIESYFSETNPFMAFVCNMKINGTHEAHPIIKDIRFDADKFLKFIENDMEIDPDMCFQGFEKYFSPNTLSLILAIKKRIHEETFDEITKDILMLALSCVAVNVSKMIRRGDLRYARPDEKKSTDFDVLRIYKNKLAEIMDDIEIHGISISSRAEKLSDDARSLSEQDLVDCVITSPPYLNGTNYIRNTKLELKVMGLIDSEEDLPHLHSRGVVAGINNVSKRIDVPNNFLCVEIENVISELEPVSYDKRIPVMVNCYFRDMNEVFMKLRQIVRNEGYFIMDIGDSQFAGIHVPTHEILTIIAKYSGFDLYEDVVLRKRTSKNGMTLTQRLLKYKLSK